MSLVPACDGMGRSRLDEGTAEKLRVRVKKSRHTERGEEGRVLEEGLSVLLELVDGFLL
jgi:hypothetical protein